MYWQPGNQRLVSKSPVIAQEVYERFIESFCSVGIKVIFIPE